MKLLSFIIMLILVSCGTKHTSQKTSHPEDTRLLHLTNPKLIQQEKNNSIAGSSLQDCRAHISEVICLVDPSDYKWDNEHPYDAIAAQSAHLNRPCLPGGEKFIKHFTEHFDHSIPMIQRMYCSLSTIWIENELSSTAYAQGVFENDKMISAKMGVRREFLESSIDLNTWFNWKEEISFGGTTSMTEASAGKNLGLIKYNSPNNSKSFIIKEAINHEFGHFFDYANKLNNYADCDFETHPEDCRPLPGSWGEMSWLSYTIVRPEMNYPVRDKLCFYSCNGKFVDSALSYELFDSLTKTNFHTIYASINPYDDFAETFSYYIQVENDDFQLSVTTQGKTIDLIEHFKSDKMKAKRDFVKNFINSDFVYPGQM